MAQLRCAQTSELLFEGTPLEVATAAAEFAADDVMPDDVGPKFNAEAVREYRAAELAGLEAALAELPAKAPADARASLEATIAERRARIDAGKAAVPAARAALQAARARVAERQAEDGARMRRRR